jgi:hypothetical protein
VRLSHATWADQNRRRTIFASPPRGLAGGTSGTGWGCRQGLTAKQGFKQWMHTIYKFLEVILLCLCYTVTVILVCMIILLTLEYLVLPWPPASGLNSGICGGQLPSSTCWTACVSVLALGGTSCVLMLGSGRSVQTGIWVVTSTGPCSVSRMTECSIIASAVSISSSIRALLCRLLLFRGLDVPTVASIIVVGDKNVNCY